MGRPGMTFSTPLRLRKVLLEGNSKQHPQFLTVPVIGTAITGLNLSPPKKPQLFNANPGKI